MSQEELQDLVTHAIPGHVDRTASSAIGQLEVGTVKEEESGRIIATMEGGEVESCLALVVLQVHSGPIAYEGPCQGDVVY